MNPLSPQALVTLIVRGMRLLGDLVLVKPGLSPFKTKNSSI
jgi:hypothetical protein